MIAGSAVRTARLQAKLRTLAIVEDRERIARDLHDNVIQNLFGSGLSLQALSQKLENPEFRATLDTNVRVLNDSISSLREFIFDLNRPRRLCRRRSANSSRSSSVSTRWRFGRQLHGHLRGLPEGLIDDAVLLRPRVGERTYVRHSGSERVSVDIHGDHGKLTITVVDDGRGFEPLTTERGTRTRQSEGRANGPVVTFSSPRCPARARRSAPSCPSEVRPVPGRSR